MSSSGDKDIYFTGLLQGLNETEPSFLKHVLPNTSSMGAE